MKTRMMLTLAVVGLFLTGLLSCSSRKYNHNISQVKKAALNQELLESKERDAQLMKMAFHLNPDSVKVLYGKQCRRGAVSSIPLLLSVEARKNDTRVTFAQPVYWDSQWFYYSPGFTLLDQETGDKYPVIGYDGGVPMDRLLILEGMYGKYFYVHLIFPKLKKNVKRVDVLELPHEQDKLMLPSNDDGKPKCYHHIKVDRD